MEYKEVFSLLISNIDIGLLRITSPLTTRDPSPKTPSNIEVPPIPRYYKLEVLTI